MPKPPGVVRVAVVVVVVVASDFGMSTLIGAMGEFVTSAARRLSAAVE